MRLVFLLLLYFISTSFVFASEEEDKETDRLVKSTLKAYNKSEPTKIMFYGVVISNGQILLPSDADDFRDDLGEITYFDNTTYLSTSSAPLVELKNNFILKELPFVSASVSVSISMTSYDGKVLSISRYPAVEGFDFKIVTKGPEDKPCTPEIFMLPSTECTEFYPSFDEKTQVCGGDAGNETEPGIPLIAVIDKIGYLVGLSANKTSDNATLFDLIVDRDYIFPIYEKCSYLENLIPQFTYCNCARISKNLIAVGHDEVVVVGNVPFNNVFKFAPFGLATVVSDNQAIVPRTVLDSLKNFEIYGNGLPLKIAVMLDGISFTSRCNFTHEYDRMFTLVTFEKPFFKDTKKAQFLFDESFQKIEKNANIDTFQFLDEQFQLQKNNERRKQKFQKFLFGAPAFRNGYIIGFHDHEETFISVFKLKEFLQKSAPNLMIETPQTSSTTVSTASTQ